LGILGPCHVLLVDGSCKGRSVQRPLRL
jgi:hypothetical protein